MSPSFRRRSTVQPTSNVTLLRETHDMSILDLFGRTTNRTSSVRIICFRILLLYDVTFTGTVNVFAILSGIPTSSIPSTSSPVMTLRAVKSHRLPIKFPRILPSLVLRRAWRDVYSLFEDRTVTLGNLWWFMYPVTDICRCSCTFSIICSGREDEIFLNLLFCLII